MKRDYPEWEMPNPESLECPDQRLELRLQTYDEMPPPPAANTRVLASLALDYEIGERHDRKGPSKPKVLPEVWCPGQEFDPATLELLLKLTPVGNA
jgi:hypothetical protein